MQNVPVILKALDKFNSFRLDPLFSQVLLKLLDEKERDILFLILLKCKITLDDVFDRNVLRSLNNLHLLQIDNDKISLNDEFRLGLLKSLGHVGSYEFFIPEHESSSKLNENIAEFYDFSDHFNNILSVLVNTKSKNHDKKHILIRKIFSFSNYFHHGITHEGFSFLLMSRKEQMWSFLLAAIDSFVGKHADLKLFLLFLLFDMGNYGKKTLKLNQNNKKVQNLLEKNTSCTIYINHFFELLETIGIVSITKKIENTFYFTITPVYFSLFNSSHSVDRFLILETNYKLYSTDISDHTKSVLSLFSNIKSVLPNLIICHIDEISITQALNMGITGQQICDYISDRSTKFVNDIVLEQILIWEKKKNRIAACNAILYDHFESFQEFQSILNFCQDFLLCVDKDRRLIVVKEEDHEKVKLFIKEHIKR